MSGSLYDYSLQQALDFLRLLSVLVQQYAGVQAVRGIQQHNDSELEIDGRAPGPIGNHLQTLDELLGCSHKIESRLAGRGEIVEAILQSRKHLPPPPSLPVSGIGHGN